MKNIKYIIYSFITLFLITSCSENGIDTRLSNSDFFVAFDTKNESFKSATIVEGDTAIVSIAIGAAKGSSVTVDFDIIAPVVNNQISAYYKLLSMDNQEMTEKRLTFPEGTGVQKFKFVTKDNDIIDGSRSFALSIISNSAGYALGVGDRISINSNGDTIRFREAKDYKITILDDDIWQSVGSGSYVSAIFGATIPANFLRSVENPNIYKMRDVFANDIIIVINPTGGKSTIAAQSLGEDIFAVGSETWIRCNTGTYGNGVCTFGGDVWDNAFYTNSALSSGLRMKNEKINLPQGSY